MLEIDWKVVVFSIINFAVLATVLTKLLYKPVLRMLDQRRADIDGALAQAAQARQLAAGTEAQLQQETAQAKEEAAALIAAGREQAEAERQRLLAQAREEAAAYAKQEAERLERQRRQTETELQQRAAELACAAAETLLRQSLTAGQQQALVDDYIREAGDPA